jgi:hypothetical protein
MLLCLSILWRIALQVYKIGYITCQYITYNSTYQQSVAAARNLSLLCKLSAAPSRQETVRPWNAGEFHTLTPLSAQLNFTVSVAAKASRRVPRFRCYYAFTATERVDIHNIIMV